MCDYLFTIECPVCRTLNQITRSGINIFVVGVVEPCVICLDRPRQIRLPDCQHIVLCFECGVRSNLGVPHRQWYRPAGYYPIWETLDPDVHLTWDQYQKKHAYPRQLQIKDFEDPRQIAAAASFPMNPRLLERMYRDDPQSFEQHYRQWEFRLLHWIEARDKRQAYQQEQQEYYDHQAKIKNDFHRLQDKTRLEYFEDLFDSHAMGELYTEMMSKSIEPTGPSIVCLTCQTVCPQVGHRSYGLSKKCFKCNRAVSIYLPTCGHVDLCVDCASTEII